VVHERREGGRAWKGDAAEYVGRDGGAGRGRAGEEHRHQQLQRGVGAGPAGVRADRAAGAANRAPPVLDAGAAAGAVPAGGHRGDGVLVVRSAELPGLGHEVRRGLPGAVQPPGRGCGCREARQDARAGAAEVEHAARRCRHPEELLAEAAAPESRRVQLRPQRAGA